MPEKRTLLSLISVVVSGLALVATAVTVYISFLRPVNISLQTSPYLYISNTIGGLPRVKLIVGILGSGSSNRYQCISNVVATIQRKKSASDLQGIAKEEVLIPTTGDSGALFAARPADLLPIYIRGGQEKVASIEFEYENTVNRIVKIKEWVSSLRSAILSEEVRKQLDKIIGPVVTSYYQKNKTNEMTQLFMWTGSRTPANQSESLESILNRLPPDEYSKYIFFTAGNYQLKVRFFSPNSVLIDETVIDFSIDSSESARLINVFDQWTLKRI